MATKTFEPADYVIIALTLIITMAVGIYHAFRSNKTTSDYLVGNRNLHFIPVTISLSASLYSSVLVLGFPAENYSFGGMYWLYAIGVALGAVMTCLIFVPVFHPLKLTSVNQYLQMRYNSTFVSILGTFSSIVLMILYTGVVYFGPATALNAITKFPVWASILVCGLFTCVYTSIGGIRAVIWTDVFQATLMVISLLAVSIQGILLVGGIDNVWDICKAGGRLEFNEFSADPTIRFTFWSLTIGTGFYDLNRYGIQQPSVQRFSSVPTMLQACLTILLTIPLVLGMISLTSLSGLSMYAFYAKKGCDPIRSQQISNANQLMPHFVLNDLDIPAFPGILFAGLISASLSTASSNLNACAANLWDDVFRKVWPNLPESKNLLTTKLIVVIFGAISMGITFIVSSVGGTLAQMIITFMAACGGPTTAMFFMGVFLPFANWIGAAAGGITGFIFSMWMGFGSYSINTQRKFLPTTIANCSTEVVNITMMSTPGVMSSTYPTSTLAMTTEENPLKDFYSVSYLWIALFSLLVSLAAGIIVSLITGCSKGEKVSSKLFHPLVRRFMKMPMTEEDLDEVVREKDAPFANGYGYEDKVDKGEGYVNPVMDGQPVLLSTKL